ncbi:MAG: hypothetical protein V4772_06730 [Pseudomonadota bacterium]
MRNMAYDKPSTATWPDATPDAPTAVVRKHHHAKTTSTASKTSATPALANRAQRMTAKPPSTRIQNGSMDATAPPAMQTIKMLLATSSSRSRGKRWPKSRISNAAPSVTPRNGIETIPINRYCSAA